MKRADQLGVLKNDNFSGHGVLKGVWSTRFFDRFLCKEATMAKGAVFFREGGA
jgi:hypothetical protein